MSWTLLTPKFASDEFGFNVAGFVTGSMGLGVACRNTIKALHGAGFPLSLCDIYLTDGRSGSDNSCLEFGVHADRIDPFSVNVFHCNPPEARELIGSGRFEVSNRFNVCVPFWEMTLLPSEWKIVLGAMDLILAPSRFIQDVIRQALPESLCLHYPQAAMVPDSVAPDRRRWGFREEETIFLSSFDLSSDIRRKNPTSVLEAFVRAFPDPGNQKLVLKVNAGPDARRTYWKDWEYLQALTARHPNITLIDDVLPYAEVLNLFASSDVFMSLHRSEGLGLGLMEAMSFGVPVIATGWSGTMDFTTAENACLVKYALVPVEAEHPAYAVDYVGGQAEWAEPDLEDAARWMRRLDQDPDFRRGLGQRAREDMASRRRSFAECEPWKALRALVQQRESPLWNYHLLRVRGFADF